jgi:hypothetical protein
LANYCEQLEKQNAELQELLADALTYINISDNENRRRRNRCFLYTMRVEMEDVRTYNRVTFSLTRPEFRDTIKLLKLKGLEYFKNESSALRFIMESHTIVRISFFIEMAVLCQVMDARTCMVVPGSRYMAPIPITPPKNIYLWMPEEPT